MQTKSEPNDRFWVVVAGTPSGPFELAQIEAMLASGKVGGDSMACRLGQSEWRPIQDLVPKQIGASARPKATDPHAVPQTLPGATTTPGASSKTSASTSSSPKSSAPSHLRPQARGRSWRWSACWRGSALPSESCRRRWPRTSPSSARVLRTTAMIAMEQASVARHACDAMAGAISEGCVVSTVPAPAAFSNSAHFVAVRVESRSRSNYLSEFHREGSA